VKVDQSYTSQPYVVITPVRNEEDYIEETLSSMINQTCLPAEWIIVNDGSTDSTGDIVRKYAQDHPWITLINKDNRGYRHRGKGVVVTFYVGYKKLCTDNYGYVVKLDADLSFPPTYFEFLIGHFCSNPCLGIAGGGLYERTDGVNWEMNSVREIVRGATKMYRRECFEDIGGLAPIPGWDGMDEWKARAKGWEVESIFDVPIYHFRCMGKATGGLRSRKEEGLGAFHMGYHPMYILLRGLRHTLTPPYIIGGMIMVLTFFLSYFEGKKRMAEPYVVKFVRRTQRAKMLALLKGRPVHDT
jgi:poly-beta-1,6-N-acetyl-D-glucosamine synthase